MTRECMRTKHAVSAGLDALFDAALSNLAGWRRAQLADARRLQAAAVAQARRGRRARAVAA